jgi:hypothetical protein
VKLAIEVNDEEGFVVWEDRASAMESFDVKGTGLCTGRRVRNLNEVKVSDDEEDEMRTMVRGEKQGPGQKPESADGREEGACCIAAKK